MLAFVIPFIYCMLIGCAWSLIFGRSFLESFAPALMTQVLIVMMSGMLFQSLSAGLYGGVLFAAVMPPLTRYVKNRKGEGREETGLRMILTDLKAWLRSQRHDIVIFICFYCFIFFINEGKSFVSPDENPFWGGLLKESLRLDGLHYHSPVSFARNNYPPGMTLVEMIWCRLSGRYMEADAYRAFQIYTFSMMLPLLQIGNPEGDRQRGTGASLFRRSVIIAFLFVFPFLFNSHDGFKLYHSIYVDSVLGVSFFYCFMVAYREEDDERYRFIHFAVASAAMLMVKHMGIAFFAMTAAVYLVRLLFLDGKKPSVKRLAGFISMLSFPLLIWMMLNQYIGRVLSSPGVATYGAVATNPGIIDAFRTSATGVTPYILSVRWAFLESVCFRLIMIWGSYADWLVGIVVLMTAVAVSVNEKKSRIKRLLAAAWVFVAGVSYMVLMYVLYCTVFPVSEGPRVASFGRYMETFLVAAILIAVLVYLETAIDKNSFRRFAWVVLFLVLNMFVVRPGAMAQLRPITDTEEAISLSKDKQMADLVAETVPEDARIFILNTPAGGLALRFRYWIMLRFEEEGMIREYAFDRELAEQIPPEEAVDVIKNYDYLCVRNLDEELTDYYRRIFDEPDLLRNETLYQITGTHHNKIVLEEYGPG